MLSKKTITLSFISILILAILYFLFYIPQEEWKFLRNVEAAFEKSNSDYIKVSETTDFDWDMICYIPKYTTKTSPVLEEEYMPILEEHLPTYANVFMNGHYFFIKNNLVEKKFYFSTMGFRPLEGHMYPLGFMIMLGDEPALFMGEHNSLNDGCILKENAAFKKLTSEKSNHKQIVITNLQKDKPE